MLQALPVWRVQVQQTPELSACSWLARCATRRKWCRRSYVDGRRPHRSKAASSSARCLGVVAPRLLWGLPLICLSGSERTINDCPRQSASPSRDLFKLSTGTAIVLLPLAQSTQTLVKSFRHRVEPASAGALQLLICHPQLLTWTCGEG